MEATDEDIVSKLVQRYNAGKSWNAADGKRLDNINELPGTVPDDPAALETNHNANNEAAFLKAEQDKERLRTSTFLDKQRQMNLNEKTGDLFDKLDYSMKESEVNLLSAQKSTMSIAAAISKCSKLILDLDMKTEAASSIPCIESDPNDDFRSSVEKLVRCHLFELFALFIFT